MRKNNYHNEPSLRSAMQYAPRRHSSEQFSRVSLVIAVTVMLSTFIAAIGVWWAMGV